MIELFGVCYNYKEIEALKDINLNIKKGESVAVIGSNGSGKSTLLKLLNGIVCPDKGSYIFDGTEITIAKMQDNKFSRLFHKRIGFVFQNPDVQLFCSSVYEEVAFGPMQMGLGHDEIKKRVDDCLDLLGITSLKDRIPYHLSGGEKKKVALASVLASNPEVLVLDEPMNGLDPKTKRFLRDFIIKLNSFGKTIICATHDFEYIEGIFKRALVFSKDHTIVRDNPYDIVINDRRLLEEHNII